MTDDTPRCIVRAQFGTNLNDDMVSSFVSPILRWIIDNNALQEEGIFRLSGNTLAVESLVERLNSGESVVLTRRGDEIVTRVHDVTSLLKHFLRKLPEPVVTNDCFAMFLAVDSIPEQEHEARIDLLRRLVSYLPDANRRLLAMLCLFLHRVVQHSAQNKMSAVSLGMVFAPALILNLQKSGDQALELVKEVRAAQNVIALLINNHSDVFGDEMMDDDGDQEGSVVEKAHGVDDGTDAESDAHVEVTPPTDHVTSLSKECNDHDHVVDDDYDRGEPPSLVLDEVPALQSDEPCRATRDALMDCNFDREEANDIATKIKRLSVMLKHELELLDTMDNNAMQHNNEHQGQREASLTDSDFSKLHKAVRPAMHNSTI